LVAVVTAPPAFGGGWSRPRRTSRGEIIEQRELIASIGYPHADVCVLRKERHINGFGAGRRSRVLWVQTRYKA